MIDEDKRVELLWAQIVSSREFIAQQIRVRFYLIGATFAFVFLLLLPAGVPSAVLNGVAEKYGIHDFSSPQELLSTLLWFGWSTSTLEAYSRSVVIAREAKHLRSIESQFLPLAGSLVTRQTDFATLRIPYLRGAEIAYMLTFAGTTMLVGGYRLIREWETAKWNLGFVIVDTLLFAGTMALMMVGHARSYAKTDRIDTPNRHTNQRSRDGGDCPHKEKFLQAYSSPATITRNP